MLALALLLSGPALAENLACAHPVESSKSEALDELEEVVVTSEKAARRTKDLKRWLKALAGKYTYEGNVDLCGRGNPAYLKRVSGDADCVVSGENPNVQCTFNVNRPEARRENGEPVQGGVSSLRPAYVVYSLDNRYLPESRVYELGLMFSQVDNRGIAEWASGSLMYNSVINAFISREPCIGMLEACRKITRISTYSNNKEALIQIDVEIDNRRVLRQLLMLRRRSN